ncbi:MAG: Fe-S cluster assembly protein SufD [Acidimicrobiia bacterium]|nr:Fe-S cluster assembly protein SufD [Acidimicrobiia bacterium]
MTKETAGRGAAGLPEPAGERIERGIALFESLPMPDPREEDWRYVELGIDLGDAALPGAPGTPMDPAGSMVTVVGDVAGRALSVDGTTLECEGEGITSLQSAGEAAWADRGRLGVPADLDRFSAAQHAFGTDGILIEVPAGKAVAAPYFFEVQAVTPGALVRPRLIVDAGDGSEVAVVVHYRSPDGVALIAVPHVEVAAGANANVSVTVVQMWGDQTTAIAQHHHVAGRDAVLGLTEAGIGGQFSRLHMRMDLDGPGSDARVLGLYFGDHTQTLDYRAFMNHNAPHTTSDMFLKGAVGDHSRSVFTGLIRIEPEGQKTLAHQTNRNLVLSEGAEAHSVPNLEILANDVRCGHGSAVGPLDAEQRYYLMSRGLDRQAADRLQVKGFFEEALSRYRHQGLVAPLREAVMAKYAGIRERSTM